MDSSGRLAQSALDDLRRIVRALRVAAHQAERQLGVSGAQLFVLHELARAPGAALRTLAERTATDPSSVSVVVGRLEAAGLVARRPDPRDRRRAALRLTARGAALVRRSPAPVPARLVAALRALPRRELVTTGRVLARLAAAVGGGAAPMFFEDGRRGA
jgi:DNA-binding MarR family transcriptional regulator